MIDLRKIRSKFGRKVDYVNLNTAYRSLHQDVLADLAEFCGAIHPAPAASDLGVQMRAAGRRDVWLHIQHHRNLTPAQVYALLEGKPIVQQPVE
ncbi:MAG: hypothetical protein ACRDRB_04150 [Pseudonocardiaceae bacterium]